MACNRETGRHINKEHGKIMSDIERYVTRMCDIYFMYLDNYATFNKIGDLMNNVKCHNLLDTITKNNKLIKYNCPAIIFLG